jgi:hypothetical protein
MIKPLRLAITPTVIAATTTTTTATLAAEETRVAEDAVGAKAATEVEAQHSIVRRSGHHIHTSSNGPHYILIHNSSGLDRGSNGPLHHVHIQRQVTFINSLEFLVQNLNKLM